MGENLSNFKTNGNLFGYSCQQYYGSGNNEISWIFEYGDNEQSIESAFLTLQNGRFDSSICVTMRADFSDRERFIDEILKFASHRRVSRIGIESLGPHDLALPAFDNETNRMIATAYVVDLKEFDEKESLSKNHLRNVRKSEKNGIEFAM